jgi:hypothetical protein
MKYKDFYSDLTEDYPPTWNKDEFEKINSFSGKLRYARQHLQIIASGSGRSVFKIDDAKVIKIAKNKKGLAQNKVESDWSMAQYEIPAKTFDIGDDVQGIGPFWVEMELARKTTRSRFKSITGVSIDDLAWYLGEEERKKTPRKFFSPLPQKIQQEMENNEFVTDLMTLLHDYDMGFGDAGRLSSYGEVLRDGKPAIVMVDYGLTRDIFNDYYKVG